MGRFIIGHGDDGKAIYQYVYGNSYDEALKKVQIGMEVESRYRSGKEITISEVYHEWIAAVANRVKESTYVNYCTKFEKHILPEFGCIACSAVSAGKLNSFINKKLADGLSASYIRDIITVFKLSCGDMPQMLVQQLFYIIGDHSCHFTPVCSSSSASRSSQSVQAAALPSTYLLPRPDSILTVRA